LCFTSTGLGAERRASGKTAAFASRLQKVQIGRLDNKPGKQNETPESKKEASELLAKIRPKWWRKGAETKELDQANPPTLRNDEFTSFAPKRPKDGYSWSQEAWHGTVTGTCVHCKYSNTNPPTHRPLPADQNSEAPASENAPDANKGSPPIPFVVPHHWVHKVPKGLLGFLQLSDERQSEEPGRAYRRALWQAQFHERSVYDGAAAVTHDTTLTDWVSKTGMPLYQRRHR